MELHVLSPTLPRHFALASPGGMQLPPQPPPQLPLNCLGLLLFLKSIMQMESDLCILV